MIRNNLHKSAYRISLVKIFSYLGLLYAIVGWLNEVWLRWVDTVFLSHYSEYMAIGVFGVYRMVVEKNPYTRKRIAVLTAMVLGFWGLLPYLFALSEPAFGYYSDEAVWGKALHTPMTLTFFLAIILVLLFGRRAVCSWNCPCVGSRDTMGAAFREQSAKSSASWKLRHFKWILTGLYFIMIILAVSPVPMKKEILDAFFGFVGSVYFASFLFVPVTGNRNWCRWICPYGGTLGILNKVGFFKIKAEADRCLGCNKCVRECDMGVPVQKLVKSKGHIKTVECVGCGRCVTICPKGVLSFRDVRHVFMKDVDDVDSGKESEKTDTKPSERKAA